MTFDEAIPIIEGKLYAWAEWRRDPDRPTASISSVYSGEIPTPGHTSPQEAWAVRRQAQIAESGLIESAVRQCSPEQRQLIFHRYAERLTWVEVSERLCVGERTAYRIRDQALASVAFALGFWDE